MLFVHAFLAPSSLTLSVLSLSRPKTAVEVGETHELLADLAGHYGIAWHTPFYVMYVVEEKPFALVPEVFRGHE